MKPFDLRSDTITKPVDGMRSAMAQAEVGDDVYFEDPTINRLEAMSAERLGKEAALFVSSGSMGNLIPLFINGGRGSEVITHCDSHIVQHEVGAVSAIAGVLPIGIDAPRGILTPALVEAQIKPHSYDLARTAMIEVENTIGGICYPLSTLQAIRSLATERALSVHMDGARLWNASIATKVDIATIAAQADTVTFCLSKGLGAPVGSVLCGNKDFIARARAVRKMLGGGMRQAGILAAAGIYALEYHVDRLADDHAWAKSIARSLEKTGWAQLEVDDVETNIIFFSVEGCTGERAAEVLGNHGILCSGSRDTVRLVTNLDLDDDDVAEVCSIIEHLDPKEFRS